MKKFLALPVLLATSTGCVTASVSTPSGPCVVEALAVATSIRATDAGVVFAVPSGTDGDVLVRRAVGDACSLEPAGGAPIAADSLLDVDASENVYVMPAEATTSDAISTMLPDEFPGSMVARVDASGAVSKLLPAGRGIWGFGVSPSGDALWVSACGPTGLYGIDAAGATHSDFAMPDSLWEQRPAALTDKETFWSVGVRTCKPGEPTTAACGFALTRTTRGGSVEFGSTIVDLGAGPEEATLARCGARVCGTTPSGVVVWGTDGAVHVSLDRAALGARATESVKDATGNEAGLYVILAEGTTTRVVFVPVD